MEGFKKASALLFLMPLTGASPRASISSRCPSRLEGAALSPHHCAQHQILGPKGAPGQLLLSESHWGFGGTSLNCTPFCRSLLAWSDGNPNLDVGRGLGGVCPHCSPLAHIPASAGQPFGGCYSPCLPQPSAFVVFLFFPFPAAGTFPWEPLVGEGRPGEKSQRLRL